MYALIQCKRENSPATTAVDVKSVQFAEDISATEFTAPHVGDIGTAALELDPTVAADALIIGKMANNPTAFRVMMKSGSQGGWTPGYGVVDRDRLTIPTASDEFERKLSSVDMSKGGPSLLRSKEITFFKNV